MLPSSAGALIGRQLGDYRLEALLGVGGMAEVYRARELALDREVAVKVLPASLAADAGYVERFRDEAKRVAALQHQHIVPVYTFSDTGPLLYLVMPILKESLRERLKRETRLAPHEAVRIVSEVASGLEVAHAHGLVHRDVKPENVLLDDQGTAMLTDFGIAREVSFARQGGAQTLSGTGLPVGTPEYMAPEQLRNEPVDQRADVYALGAVLYELLTGVAPHEAETPYEVAAHVLMAPLTPPAERNPAIWPALEQVVLRALASRPEARYETATGFAAALQEALDVPEAERFLAETAPRRSYSRYSTRRFTHPPDLETTEDIAEAGTLPAITIVRPVETIRGWRGLLPARGASRQQWLLLIGVAALLVTTLCGGGSLVLANGLGLMGRSGPATAPPSGITGIPEATVTALAQSLATSIAQGTPGAAATATALATAIARPTTSGTATPTNTAQPTPTNTPQATVTPVPGAPLTLTNIPLVKAGKGGCKGTQTINNTSSKTVGWTWTVAPSGLKWSLDPDSSASQTGLPNDAALAAHQSDIVYVAVACNDYTFNMADSKGNTYSGIQIFYHP
jgi:hypothetical protein